MREKKQVKRRGELSTREKSKVYFGKDGSISILFPFHIKHGLETSLYFGNIRGVGVLVKNGKVVGLRFSDERALRTCEIINGYPPADEILALRESGNEERDER